MFYFWLALAFLIGAVAGVFALVLWIGYQWR